MMQFSAVILPSRRKGGTSFRVNFGIRIIYVYGRVSFEWQKTAIFDFLN